MSDAIEQEIAGLKEDIESLRREMKRLVRSDRAQTKKLKWQHRLTLISFGAIALGGATMFSGLSVEDKAILERVAVGVLAAGVSGAVGVNLPGFEVSTEEEDEI